MANYTHQGPGHRCNCQQSPPVYSGGHSPGPRPPNFYPYPPQFHQHQHLAPPPRGNHPRGSYGSRSGYYQQQPALYAAHYPAKYNSAPYHYPSPNAPVFTLSWQQQQQQPISPLLKQLSMPQPSAPITHQEPPTESEIPLPLPLQTPPPTSSTYSYIGSISTAHESTQPISNPGIAKWAIWSRRPQDPTLAPSIIISPKPVRPPISSHKPRISKHHLCPRHLHVLRLFFRQNRPSYLRLRSSIPLSIFRSSCYPLTKLRVWPGLLSFAPPPPHPLHRLPLVQHVTPSLPLLSGSPYPRLALQLRMLRCTYRRVRVASL